MKTLLTIFASALFLIICTVNLSAQDTPEPKKRDNPEWKRVVLVDYYAGKAGMARKIIKEYFQEAGKKAGTPGPSLSLVMVTGEYDQMYVWDMHDGIESLNWERSPNSIKWWQAMIEVAGSEEKAEEIQAEYRSCVRSSRSDLVRVFK